MEQIARTVDESEQGLLSAILILQDERDKAVQRLEEEVHRRAARNKFADTLLTDMNEMSKALDRSRQTARRAKLVLEGKEAEVQRLLVEKRELLSMMIEGEPRQLWEWAKKEIAEQGLEPGDDFEKRWLAWVAATEDVASTGSEPAVQDEGTDSANHITGKIERPSVSSGQHHLDSERRNWSQGYDGAEKSGLLRILFTMVLEEGMVNFQYVLKKGLFFLPMAVFCFWMRFSLRLSWLVAGGIASRLGQSPLAGLRPVGMTG